MPQEIIKEYIGAINAQLRTGAAGEHAYRPALQRLLEALLPGHTVVNEPARVRCGAPDLLIADRRTGQPAGYVECKDLDDGDLDGKGKNRDQFARYRGALGCVIFTDYLDFHLYAAGELRLCARVAAKMDDRVQPVAEGAAAFLELVACVRNAPRAAITTPGALAAVMAGKARLLAAAVHDALQEDAARGQRDGYAGHYLRSVYSATRQELVHDLSEEAFADLYAQTITYGLFAARLHDDTPERFSRLEAAQRIPMANPFLRRAFQDIAGFDLDPRIAWVVDDLVGAFALADMRTIMAGYAALRGDADPLMHFYEDFLAAYNSQLRKARGVWYTPAPVVRFIVRAVDDLLAARFGLRDGLADASETTRSVKNPHTGEVRQETVHRVQLLDPAAGTGTFLAEAVRRIHGHFGCAPEGLWRDYAARHLLPRLMGFELLMASHAVAHVKLDAVLAATGYQLGEGDRLNLFLTNALEPYSVSQRATIPWLSEEGAAANRAKLQCPVMVMLGNPPYSVSSSNRGEWIEDLTMDYKRGLNERNIQPLSDDYIKFIRLGQYYVERTGEGILAYITNNGFLDGVIHRQMRHELLRVFDTIYILDLHGNARKKESTPDGGKDENVFDIMQGVSIKLFVKDGSKKGELANVYHHDVWGTRAVKYDYLDTATVESVKWQKVEIRDPMYFFVPKDFSLEKEYNEGCFGVQELFTESVSGIKTHNDSFVICSRDGVGKRVSDLIHLPEAEFRQKYRVVDTKAWAWQSAREDVGKAVDETNILPYGYRVFSPRYVYYTGKTNGIIARPRLSVMRHMLRDNVGLVFMRRQSQQGPFSGVFICSSIMDLHFIGDQGYLAPLYLYSEDYSSREANMDAALLAKLGEAAGRAVTPGEAFDYVYGALHDGAYLARYAELLKVDFPRVPYPRGGEDFEAQRARGAYLRRLHLMEGAEQWELESALRGEGETVVETPAWRDGRVYINEAQYFSHVRREVWEFYIGGYQPAQKWLKDRRGERLGFDGVQMYRRVLHALGETERLVNGGHV